MRAKPMELLELHNLKIQVLINQNTLTKVIPVFWQQLVFKFLRDSFMEDREALHFKASTHQSTAPLPEKYLAIMISNHWQWGGYTVYWLGYYVEMFRGMKGKRHFGLTFLMIDRVKSGSVKVEQENSTRFRGRSMFYKEGKGWLVYLNTVTRTG